MRLNFLGLAFSFLINYFYKLQYAVKAAHAIKCLGRLDFFNLQTGQGRSIQSFHICFILEFRYQIDSFPVLTKYWYLQGFSSTLGRFPIFFLWLYLPMFLVYQSYDSKFLKIYPDLEPTPLQLEEDLEQLKVLENGYKMKV